MKICEDDKAVVATNDHGSWLLKPSWSKIESEGALVISFDGVIEPGSDVGLGFSVSPEVELSVAVTVGMIRMVEGIQLLSSERVGGSVGVAWGSALVLTVLASLVGVDVDVDVDVDVGTGRGMEAGREVGVGTLASCELLTGTEAVVVESERGASAVPEPETEADAEPTPVVEVDSETGECGTGIDPIELVGVGMTPVLVPWLRVGMIPVDLAGKELTLGIVAVGIKAVLPVPEEVGPSSRESTLDKTPPRKGSGVEDAVEFEIEVGVSELVAEAGTLTGMVGRL